VNSAQYVIKKFGGQSALAALIGKGQSTVQHWSKVGLIPAKWQGDLLRLASERNLDLNPSDFVKPPAYETIHIDIGTDRVPRAQWWGVLAIGEQELPCYVLDNGLRVMSRTGATSLLTDKKGGGNLEQYLRVEGLAKYLPSDFSAHLIEFEIRDKENKRVMGMSADTFLDICKGYVRALADNKLKTERQTEIATKASMFLAACAKVGLTALIDEATGHQYDRAEDALRVKLKAYLEEEMRAWEKTFPDELWKEFGRLTKWEGSVTQRPKYWGKLVMELVYEYLDPDVADWLRNNAPKPRHGDNYHQWLSSQYGLKKLVEHIWMLIGMASACHNMSELRQRMAEKYGRQPVQYTLYLPPIRG